MTDHLENIQKYINASRLQELMHNNHIDNKKLFNNIDIIKNAIENGDNDILKNFHNIVFSDHEIRIHLIKKILLSDYIIKNDIIEIKKFFGMLSPLNIEYNLGSKMWNFKIYNNYLLVQNNILKTNLSMWFYENYLNHISKILKLSNIDYNYKEFKNRRFFKSKDIVFVIQI